MIPPCPQYEVEIASPEVRQPRTWTPLIEKKLKPKPARMIRGRPVGERARRWQRMMDEGDYPTMSALARAEGVTPAAVSRALIQLRRATVRKLHTVADHRTGGR